MSIVQCESHFTAANIRLVFAFPHAVSPSSAPRFLPGCWHDHSLEKTEESSTTLLAQKLFEILLLPLSRTSSVFPHHSESAPSSPSPFLLLCESPGGNRHHNYRQGSRTHSSNALATLLKERVTLPSIQRGI